MTADQAAHMLVLLGILVALLALLLVILVFAIAYFQVVR